MSTRRNPLSLGFLNRQWISVLALWGLWLGLLIFGYLGQNRRYQELRRTLVPIQDQVKVYTDLIARMPNVEEDLEQERLQLERLKQQSLGREAIPKAIQEIAQIAAATGVALETVTPMEEIKGAAAGLPEGVGRRMIEVRLRCSYLALGEFLAKMDELSTRFILSKISLRAEVQNPEQGSVRAQLLLSTYGLL